MLPARITRNIPELARGLIHKYQLKDTFYIVDKLQLTYNVTKWRALLPDVSPFYAIKCNPDPVVVKDLAKAGVGFDCASRNEIAQVSKISADVVNRIIFAHPQKREEDMRYAARMGVRYTTFDTESELVKLSKNHPSVCTLLRIKIDNPSARVQLGAKYGAALDEVPELVKCARKLGLRLGGICFHVGSASSDPMVFEGALETAHSLLGHCDKKLDRMVIDMGGGFTADGFDAAAEVISKSLKHHQKMLGNYKNDLVYWAEPGRYMVEDVFTMFTPIVGSRRRESNDYSEYWIGDGLYGSFNCMLYDQQEPRIEALQTKETLLETERAHVWGASCDSHDGMGFVELPKGLKNGDWLMVPRFGAYTLAGACKFNGFDFDRPRMFYVD